MKGRLRYCVRIAIAGTLAMIGTVHAADRIADVSEAPATIYASEAVQGNSQWNPEFLFEVNVSLASLQREARPVVMCEVFGPVPDDPNAVVGWGKQYLQVNLNSEGSFSGRVTVPYKVPSRFLAESAKKYRCFLYLQDYGRGVFVAPGNYGSQIPNATVKPGTPLVWQVGGDIPRE